MSFRKEDIFSTLKVNVLRIRIVKRVKNKIKIPSTFFSKFSNALCIKCLRRKKIALINIFSDTIDTFCTSPVHFGY